MLSSYIVDFLLICIIALCYLTLYADPQLKIAIFWSSKTIVLIGALRVKKDAGAWRRWGRMSISWLWDAEILFQFCHSSTWRLSTSALEKISFEKSAKVNSTGNCGPLVFYSDVALPNLPIGVFTLEFFLMKMHSVEFHRILWNLINHWSMNWDKFNVLSVTCVSVALC